MCLRTRLVSGSRSGVDAMVIRVSSLVTGGRAPWPSSHATGAVPEGNRRFVDYGAGDCLWSRGRADGSDERRGRRRDRRGRRAALYREGSGKRRGPGRPKGSGAGVARRGPRPAGTSLKDHLGKVLKASSKPIGVKDLTKKVVRGGYKTKSKNLPNQVSMALSQMVKSRQAKKVSRGLYAG